MLILLPQFPPYCALSETLSVDAQTLIISLRRYDIKGPSRPPLHGKEELYLLEDHRKTTLGLPADSNLKKQTLLFVPN